MMGRGRRVVRRRAVVGTAMGVAATASMVSNARRNRAERQAIEQATQNTEDQQGQGYDQPEEQAAPAAIPTEELEKLAKLRDQGIITEEEFQAKKKELLGL